MRVGRGGGMPFAVIGVTLLLLSAGFVMVVMENERASRGTERIAEEIGAMDLAAESATAHVNRGLGERILMISTDDDLGDMESRLSDFPGDVDRWLDNQFPLTDHGIRIELRGHSVEMVTENMSISEEDGYSPTYLRAVGTVDVTMRSDNGVAERTLRVSTDGSYTLPLLADRSSLFESMVGGDGISIEEMVEYQLTSLAQYRVLSGYGALTEYGTMGSRSIITDEDVETAYSNALSAIGLISFRDGGNDVFDAGPTDLSDMILDDGDGTLEVDLSAVFAQATVSVLDEMALRWFGYLLAYELIEDADRDRDALRLLDDIIVSFLKGESVLGAMSYIEDVMKSRGVDESTYRYPGSGTTTAQFDGVMITVSNPVSDLFDEDWIRHFKADYYRMNNQYMEQLTSILNTAAVMLSERRGLGTVVVEVDPHDGETALEAVMDAVEGAFSGYRSALHDAMHESILDHEVYDPFYAAIADSIEEHSEDLVDESAFMSSLRHELESAFGGTDVDVDSLMASPTATRMLEAYRHNVLSSLDVYESMRWIPGGGQSLLDRILARTLSAMLDATSIPELAEDRTISMCMEILDLGDTNPGYGMEVLPTSSAFTVTDEYGNSMTERVHLTIDRSDPVVIGPRVDRDRCTHMTGFRESTGAAFTTVFSVSLEDEIRYSLIGRGALSDAMGRDSSRMSSAVHVDMDVDVVVVSGWPLTGIPYSASNDVIDDVSDVLMDVLEPIIEPLMEVMEALRNMLSPIAEHIVRAGSMVADQVVRVYESLMDPLTEITDWIWSNLDEVLGNATLRVLFSVDLGSQRISFGFLGYTLTIEGDLMSLNSGTKTLLSVTISGPFHDMMLTAGITVKTKDNLGSISAEGLIITGNGKVQGDDWYVNMKLDPLMKGSRYLVAVNGDVHGTDFSVTAPDLEEYHEMGLTLSDIPGVGEVLGNIPLPVPGMKGNVDAGFNLKYSTPMVTGLIINEIETNPPGEDRGREWVELFNGTRSPIDLDGYTLVAGSDWRTKVMDLSGTIDAGGYAVFHMDGFQLVNDSGKYTKNGEKVTLKDPDGEVVDKTPTVRDTSDDGDSWQRAFDRSTEWVFKESSEERSNGGSVVHNILPGSALKDLVWRAVEESFDDVGSITDTKSLGRFLESLVRHTLDNLIDRISGQIVEASVFASLDVQDLTGTGSTGLRVALRTDSELAGDVMRYLAGQLQSVLLGMSNPYSIDPVGMFTENIDLEVQYHAEVGFPGILSKGVPDLPSMDLGVVFRTNLASIGRVIGDDIGRPETEFGIRAIDCPSAVIPQRLKMDENMERDLWLIRVTVSPP